MYLCWVGWMVGFPSFCVCLCAKVTTDSENPEGCDVVVSHTPQTHHQPALMANQQHWGKESHRVCVCVCVHVCLCSTLRHTALLEHTNPADVCTPQRVMPLWVTRHDVEPHTKVLQILELNSLILSIMKHNYFLGKKLHCTFILHIWLKFYWWNEKSLGVMSLN